MSRKILIEVPDWSIMDKVFNILKEAMDAIGIFQYSMKEIFDDQET